MAGFESRAEAILKMHEGVFGQSLEKNSDMEQFTDMVESWLHNAILHEMGEMGGRLRDELQQLLSVALLAKQSAHVAETADYDRQKFGQSQILEARPVEARLLASAKAAGVEAQKDSDLVIDAWADVKVMALQILENFARELHRLEEEAQATEAAHQELVAVNDEGFQEVVEFKATNGVLFEAKRERQKTTILRFQDAKKAVGVHVAMLQENDDSFEDLAFSGGTVRDLDAREAIKMETATPLAA